ncbi:hypothetical protein [Heyndrickxia sporothermodurans]|uniref:hypothetical protein n=1 Tax=Heyndrickxia sporothermodurans TaxID=46224 RepID=UPI000D360242|nr:hypothetical protein [Heyndrickxia sporothermodurans]MED3781567.1 hypothetical protein [Heyndrickxia sporothermodurans]PTY76633.1 hypothetical protein B5V89_17300 [Heyndrickxia sporothermodurans]
MIIYFSFVGLAFIGSIVWSMFRLRKFEIYKKPLIEATIINISLHIIGLIWWIVINWGIILTLIPGIVYYILSMSIINTINWLVLSLFKPKKQKQSVFPY